VGGRPLTCTFDTLLECMGEQRLTSRQWRKNCSDEFGASGRKSCERLEFGHFWLSWFQPEGQCQRTI
jgi:hypothetical protein